MKSLWSVGLHRDDEREVEARRQRFGQPVRRHRRDADPATPRTIFIEQRVRGHRDGDARQVRVRDQCLRRKGDPGASVALTGCSAAPGTRGRKISPVPLARLSARPATASHALPTNG